MPCWWCEACPLRCTRAVGRTRAWAAGLLQATSLTFIVVATVVGVEIGHQVPSTATALVMASLPSVIVYPQAALRLLQAGTGRAASAPGSGVPDPARPGDRDELPGIFTIAV